MNDSHAISFYKRKKCTALRFLTKYQGSKTMTRQLRSQVAPAERFRVLTGIDFTLLGKFARLWFSLSKNLSYLDEIYWFRFVIIIHRGIEFPCVTYLIRCCYEFVNVMISTCELIVSNPISSGYFWCQTRYSQSSQFDT